LIPFGIQAWFIAVTSNPIFNKIKSGECLCLALKPKGKRPPFATPCEHKSVHVPVDSLKKAFPRFVAYVNTSRKKTDGTTKAPKRKRDEGDGEDGDDKAEDDPNPHTRDDSASAEVVIVDERPAKKARKEQELEKEKEKEKETPLLPQDTQRAVDDFLSFDPDGGDDHMDVVSPPSSAAIETTEVLPTGPIQVNQSAWDDLRDSVNDIPIDASGTISASTTPSDNTARSLDMVHTLLPGPEHAQEPIQEDIPPTTNDPVITLNTNIYQPGVTKFYLQPRHARDPTIIKVTVSSGPNSFMAFNTTSSTGIGFTKLFLQPLENDLPTDPMIAAVDYLMGTRQYQQSQLSPNQPCDPWLAALHMDHRYIPKDWNIVRHAAEDINASLELDLVEKGMVIVTSGSSARSYKWTAMANDQSAMSTSSSHALTVWSGPMHKACDGDSHATTAGVTMFYLKRENSSSNNNNNNNTEEREEDAPWNKLSIKLVITPCGDQSASSTRQAKPLAMVSVQPPVSGIMNTLTYEEAVCNVKEYSMMRLDYEAMNSAKNLRNLTDYFKALTVYGPPTGDNKTSRFTTEEISRAIFSDIHVIKVDGDRVSFSMPVPCLHKLLEIRAKKNIPRIYFVCGEYVSYLLTEAIVRGQPDFHVFNPDEGDFQYSQWRTYLSHCAKYKENENDPAAQFQTTQHIVEAAKSLFGDVITHNAISLDEYRRRFFFTLKTSSTSIPNQNGSSSSVV